VQIEHKGNVKYPSNPKGRPNQIFRASLEVN
jgi:hypothetical protein